MGRHNRSEEAFFDFIPNKKFSCLIRRGEGSWAPSEPPLDPPLGRPGNVREFDSAVGGNVRGLTESWKESSASKCCQGNFLLLTSHLWQQNVRLVDHLIDLCVD